MLMAMSKKVIVLIIIFLFLTTAVSAEDTLITVIVPSSAPEITTKPVKPTAPAPKLYPVSVTENVKSKRREIVKTYELSAGEKPSDIPRDSFERDNWLYEIADITKKENVKTEEKSHAETVTLDSATKDFNEVLTLLPKSKSYNNNGFTGTLTLDIDSITVEQAGTQNVGYTILESREYPYLSSNDSSFVPKTIADRYGRTLTLSSLTWRTQADAAVDYTSIPESYTAVAEYTGKAYKSVVTGYAVTAQYRGTIAKTSSDKTVYTALFIGTEIVAPVISAEAPEVTEISPESEIEEATEYSGETVTIITVEPVTEAEVMPDITEFQEVEDIKPEKNILTLILIIIIILQTAGFIVCRIIIKKKKSGGKIIE